MKTIDDRCSSSGSALLCRFFNCRWKSVKQQGCLFHSLFYQAFKKKRVFILLKSSLSNSIFVLFGRTNSKLLDWFLQISNNIFNRLFLKFSLPRSMLSSPFIRFHCRILIFQKRYASDDAIKSDDANPHNGSSLSDYATLLKHHCNDHVSIPMNFHYCRRHCSESISAFASTFASNFRRSFFSFTVKIR